MVGVVGLTLALSALVALGASSAGTTGTGDTPACAARALAPAVRTNGAGGTILIYVGLRNAGHVCSAQGQLLLALRDAKSGRLLRIVGNPHATLLRGRIRAGKHNIFTLQWMNYCGRGKPLVLVATFGGKRAVERSNYPGARCESKAAPSQLRMFRLPR
jgi:hypothetical protein